MATTVGTNDMTAKETLAHASLGAFMGSPLEKFRGGVVYGRVDKLKAYCRDNNLKRPQACKKQELIETN